MKNYRPLIVSTVCLVVFCAIAVIFKVFPLGALPASFIGAALGAVITGVVTVVLLDGQSKAEEIKERNVKIFEIKSKVFQDYIDLVWEIWADQRVTGDEYQELTSKYYRNIMIYLKDDDKLGIIGGALSKIGNYLEKDSPNNVSFLQDNMISIIDTLSEELGLGGKINKDQIMDHDSKLFPVLLRKVILESFDNVLVASNYDVLEKGQWLEWNEGNLKHNDLIFSFKKYPACSIRFGMAINADGTLYPEFTVILFIPVGAGFHAFDKFRNKDLLNRRIIIKNNHDIYKPSSQEVNGLIISPFSFKHEETIKMIRENFNYRKVSETLAQRANEMFQEITIAGEDLPIVDFLEKYYGK
jgi:hypothetical protein